MAQKLTRRRAGAILAGAIAAGLTGRTAYRWAQARFAFEALEDPPGFRRLAGGAVSQGISDPFIGLEDGKARAPLPRISAAAFCDKLFANRAEGAVPVASFSDYLCPYCRVLTPHLFALQEAGRIAVTWHELPGLGPQSLAAARAAMAADAQGQYPAFHRRLMRAAFQIDRSYVTALAESVRLDVPRFLADFDSPATAGRIGQSAALAGRFGFVGTPALVVGSTGVMGAMPLARLDALVDVEANANGPCG